VTEQPSRYQRSFSGLIGALVVTLLAIAAFVAFRALTRDELDGGPEPIDYLAQVGYAQESGAEVVYPATVPDGWTTTSAELDPGERVAWGLGMVTDDGAFVGIRQEDADLDELLARYVDEEDVETLPATDIDSTIASRWQTFEDDGGDLAYAAELGPDVVLVYGSADEADLRLVVEELTTRAR
jgi:hypothetical protein